MNDGRGRRCTQFGICKGAPMFGRRGIREELKKRKKKKIPTAMFVLMSFQKHGAFCVLWGHTYVMSAVGGGGGSPKKQAKGTRLCEFCT